MNVQEYIPIVVCGAHLSGMVLNFQLTDRRAKLLKACSTAANYRLYVIPGKPLRPGLVRTTDGSGGSIAVEVWRVPAGELGSFLAGIPSPLGLGRVLLDEGTEVTGFICEPWGIEGAEEITALGGWRAYIQSLQQATA